MKVKKLFKKKRGGKNDSTTTTTATPTRSQFELYMTEVESDLSKLESATETIQYLKDEVIRSTSIETERDIRENKLYPLVTETDSLVKKIESEMGLLKNQIISESISGVVDETSKDLNVEEIQIIELQRKIHEQLEKYLNAQILYEKDVKEKLIRIARAVKPDLSDEEIQQLQDGDANLEEIISKQLQTGKNSFLKEKQRQTYEAELVTTENVHIENVGSFCGADNPCTTHGCILS